MTYVTKNIRALLLTASAGALLAAAPLSLSIDHGVALKPSFVHAKGSDGGGDDSGRGDRGDRGGRGGDDAGFDDHRGRGRGSDDPDGDDRGAFSRGLDDLINSIFGSDDGTPDQGRGDAPGTPGAPGAGGAAGNDDGTPDQGRGDN